VTELLEEFARRWRVEFAIPAREVVRGYNALSRGMGLERLLDPGATPLAQFEEMFVAYAMGVIRNEEFATWVATCLRGMASWGLTPATRLAGIGSPSPQHGVRRIHSANVNLVASLGNDDHAITRRGCSAPGSE
jgi:hypothetical protein